MTEKYLTIHFGQTNSKQLLPWFTEKPFRLQHWICYFLSSRWSVNFVYMGLTFNVTNISGDLYLNMFILFLVELPGNYICMKLIDTRLGRRWTVGGSIAIAGISLCLVAVVPKGDIFLSRTSCAIHQFS